MKDHQCYPCKHAVKTEGMLAETKAKFTAFRCALTWWLAPMGVCNRKEDNVTVGSK